MEDYHYPPRFHHESFGSFHFLERRTALTTDISEMFGFQRGLLFEFFPTARRKTALFLFRFNQFLVFFWGGVCYLCHCHTSVCHQVEPFIQKEVPVEAWLTKTRRGPPRHPVCWGAHAAPLQLPLCASLAHFVEKIQKDCGVEEVPTGVEHQARRSRSQRLLTRNSTSL